MAQCPCGTVAALTATIMEFIVYLQECLLDKKGFYIHFAPIGKVTAPTPADALKKARAVKKNKQYGHHIAVGLAQVQETLQ